MKKEKSGPQNDQAKGSSSELIDAHIAELNDWRGEMLARLRKIIKQADPAVVEEIKWRKPSNSMRGVPVWSHDGILCTGETYKNVVKITFAKGASLDDPAGLFNASLNGNTRRAIDIREGEKIPAQPLKALIRAAVAANTSSKQSTGKKPPKKSVKTEKTTSSAKKPKKPVLLSGGNPQIAKADGDAPVQAYIAAMPGWKHDVGRRLDALIVETVPDVRKAVKWNSPFYGSAGQGWFLSFHVFTRYIKVTFFNGTSLRPLPPVESKSEETRYVHLHEDEELDEAQLASWIRQAAALPGWTP